MNTKFVESLIKSVINDDQKLMVKLIGELIDNEKKRGHLKTAQRLKKVLGEIPDKKSSTFSPSSIGRRAGSVIKIKDDSLLYEVIESKIRLEETILEPEVKEQVSGFLSEWENSSKLIEHGVTPTNKILLFGEPGTGKTKLTYGLANKLNVPLVLVRLDEIISSYLGKTGKNIREIFELAYKQKVIIFLDEIDTLAKHRDDSKELGELKRVVTVLLQNIDSFPSKSILVGATNHENLLDKAIWRRFQLKINLDIPSKPARISLFKLYLAEFATDRNAELLSELTDGLNGSAIKDVSEAIKKSAILRTKDEIELIDIVSSFKLMSSNLEMKNKKKKFYELCKVLYVQGYSPTELSSITGIPYSTLLGNIK